MSCYMERTEEEKEAYELIIYFIKNVIKFHKQGMNPDKIKMMMDLEILKRQ